MLKRWEDLNINLLINEIEKEREYVKKILSGEIKKEVKDLVKVSLFIVESPTKARTIASFFGKPSSRIIGKIRVYEVSLGDKHLLITSSKGHLIDLTTKNIGLYGVYVNKDKKIVHPYYNSIKRCMDCGYQFTEYETPKTCPVCGSKNIDDAWDRIKALQDLAQEVDEVIIGTDPDSEGEFIAYTIYLLLKPFTDKVYRAEFHEVTKQAIINSIENLRSIDYNRVKAQMVRRIEDRWLGFSLSSKVQKIFNRDYLSAGRVQTPVLGWIVNRFKEHKESLSYFLSIKAENIKIDLDLNIKSKKEAENIVNKLKNGKIILKEKKYSEEELNPLPPYMTSTLLQDASTILGLNVSTIMSIAQELFESGLITYHRTDSIRVSPVGIQVAKEYISEKYGETYFRGRSWGEGGAHECIRPTKPIDPESLRRMIESGEIELFIDFTRNHYNLYSLIFRRFIQSQMKPVKVKYAYYTLKIEPIDYEYKLEGIVDVIEDGWNLVDDYRIRSKWIDDIKLDELPIDIVTYWRSAKIRLYSQSDIINLMRERKIGRPSTYATIISKLFKRGYIIESGRKIVPTKLGIYVYLFLNNKYGEYVSEEVTRELENKMDEIEEGRLDYIEVLLDIYEEVLNIIKQEDKKEDLLNIINKANREFKLGKKGIDL